MMALLGSLLGFGTSFLPEVLNYFKANQEHKHNLERMQLEMDLMSKRAELKIQILDKEADIAETEGLYSHDRGLDGGGFVNALRASVRPVITYVFFGLFVAIKVTALIALMDSGVEMAALYPCYGTQKLLRSLVASSVFGLGAERYKNI